MADFNIMTAPISDEVDKGHVFGEVDNELVRFPATGLGGGSGEGGSTEVPPGVVFVETDETADPLPEEGEAEEGGLDADRLGGLTPPYFVKKSDLSDAFDAEKAYAVGDYCIYENALYRFTTAKEADAAWDSTYVTPVKIADEIGRVSEYSNGYTNLESGLSVSWYKFGKIVVLSLMGELSLQSAVWTLIPVDFPEWYSGGEYTLFTVRGHMVALQFRNEGGQTKLYMLNRSGSHFTSDPIREIVTYIAK